MSRGARAVALSVLAAVAGVSPVHAQGRLPTVLDDTTLFYIDERITRTYDCVVEEDALLANDSVVAAAEGCYREQCLCRGGVWDSKRWRCVHACDRVTCPPKTCRQPGTCVGDGECVYTHSADGTVCEAPPREADADYAADARYAALYGGQAEPPAPHRCYYGLCLPSLTCSGVQCPLPENECYEAACADVPEATNATSPPVVPSPPPGNASAGDAGFIIAVTNTTGCHFRPRSGNACDGGAGVCTAGTCIPVVENRTCEGVVCPPSGHMCRETVGCVEGECRDQPLADGTPCDDYNPRTTNDVCKRGSCYGEIQCGEEDGAPTLCTPSTPECVSVGCDGRGGCLELNKPDGTTCSDVDPDTHQDFCLSGRCVGASSYYSCENHDRCLPTFLQCIAPLLPSCMPTYLEQCRKVAEAQQCRMGASFCTADVAAELPVPLLVVAWGVLAPVILQFLA